MNQSFGTDTTVMLNSDSNSQYELWLKPWCNHELFADKEKKLSSNSCQFLMFFLFFPASVQFALKCTKFAYSVQLQSKMTKMYSTFFFHPSSHRKPSRSNVTLHIYRGSLHTGARYQSQLREWKKLCHANCYLLKKAKTCLYINWISKIIFQFFCLWLYLGALKPIFVVFCYGCQGWTDWNF